MSTRIKSTISRVSIAEQQIDMARSKAKDMEDRVSKLEATIHSQAAEIEKLIERARVSKERLNEKSKTPEKGPAIEMSLQQPTASPLRTEPQLFDRRPTLPVLTIESPHRPFAVKSQDRDDTNPLLDINTSKPKDLLVQRLAEKASLDPVLRNLMEKVVHAQASEQEMSDFQTYCEGLNALLQAEQV